MAEIKEMKDVTVDNKEQDVKNTTPEAPVDQKTDDQAEKKPGKIKQFFSKHSGKIKLGLGAVGAIGIGVAADRLGLKLSGKKKGDDESGGDTAE